MQVKERQVLVSRPTFAELGDALAKIGLVDAFTDDGDIVIGALRIHTDANVPQATRLAVAIDEAAVRPQCCAGDACYEDEDVAVHVKCRPDGVHVVERRPGIDARVVTLPKAALTPVAGELIECLARPSS